MKRLYIGIILLAVILAVGILLTVSFCRLHQPLAQALEQAQRAALAGDWKRADALTDSARAGWERVRRFTAAAADHEPIEEIDALFARLEPLGTLRETAEFAAVCGELSSLLTAMADSQRIAWWNLL